jgi:catechol-2,3-dioxygenase
MNIKEIHLESHDLVATADFYHQLLGLPVQYKGENSISFLVGTTLIRFDKTESGKPVYHIAFDIPNNQLETAYTWLKEKTTILPVTTGTVFSEFERWNARSLYFCDSNGNILELICRLDLDNATAKPFSASSLLHVSEIGIVTRDVPAMVRQLQDAYGLELYAKQPADDQFTVMGDEEGLFIIVHESRKWFPTQTEAHFFSTGIIFDLNGETHDLSVKERTV